MNFRLFGFEVEVQPFFWVTTFLLGSRNFELSAEIFVWVAVVFFSILVHELGHAFAYRLYGVDSSIKLHGMGGATYGRVILPLKRTQQTVVSLAGPFAGFALAGAIYGLVMLLPRAALAGIGATGGYAIDQLLWVNVIWGCVNLLPVLPFDGGHVLEQILGPKRAKLTAMISMIIGGAVTIFFLTRQMYWGAIIFAGGAMTSYMRYRAIEALSPESTSAVFERPDPDAIPLDVQGVLRSARAALDAEDYARALGLAEEALAKTLPPVAARQAFEIVGWAQLLSDRVELAKVAVSRAQKLGDVDPALEGGVLLATGDLGGARRVLEAARSRGDTRKEVAGPLIQVLIAENEIARAAQVAIDIAESLSDDDARKMATIAFDAAAFDWAARLRQVVFGRSRKADDAYEAARALACAGQLERAVEWMKKAVEAGFSDKARAWSDAALEALRSPSMLGTVLPRD